MKSINYMGVKKEYGLISYKERNKGPTICEKCENPYWIRQDWISDYIYDMYVHTYVHTYVYVYIYVYLHFHLSLNR